MSNTNNVIGIFNQEIYIKSDDSFGVLRYVAKDVLEKLHTVEGLIEYGWDDLWKQAVQYGATTDGLNDWLESVLDEEDDGDEKFPSKDDSFLDELSDEDRKAADAYILERYGEVVGTWECSGIYSPNSFGTFKGFDLVLNDRLAKEYCDNLKEE